MTPVIPSVAHVIPSVARDPGGRRRAQWGAGAAEER